MDERFPVDGLLTFAAAALAKAGLPEEPARVVAEGLVDGDLFGHTTHGLALLSAYVEELESGAMEHDGGPEVISNLGAVETWDGRRLPGIWLTKLAVAAAIKHADQFGIGAIAIRRSHHIACLAAFLEEPARRGYLVLVLSSDPSVQLVAPYGGTTPVLTPNPIAAGIPADPSPVLIDISTSVTTAGLCARAKAEGTLLPGKWLLSADGQATDDPQVMDKGGSILPIGGLDHGHKGFALSLLVEALTQGLGGFGRAEAPTEWGASVVVLAFAPGAFGPKEDFRREVNWTLDACRASNPSTQEAVRIPGELAQKRKQEAMLDGVRLYPKVVNSLQDLSRRLRVPLPRSTASSS